MKKFDTKVQHLKYKVLREVAKQAFDDNLLETVTDIPKLISPGKKPTMRCCIYKERAILGERVKLAMGGNKTLRNVIEVIDIACDECPVSGYAVSDACRGCIAHHCEDACPRDAITFDEHQKAHIDKSKCVECGLCAKVCPYSAISDHKRPCENACKVKAISMGESKAAEIDDSKCISCGACVYKCPFGAISDKSYMLDVIRLIKNKTPDAPLFAVVAPSVASQFVYASPGQLVSGLLALGFDHVTEAALGADMMVGTEAAELVEQGFLTSSCCPAFVDYTRKQFPSLAEHISTSPSPMAVTGAYLKQNHPGARVVFIGPCTAKKMEFRQESVSPFIDSVITFEELQALLDSREIDIAGLEESLLDDASCFGRMFAHSGGLARAAEQALKEQGLEDFVFKPVSCDGIDACRVALLKASKNLLDGNFIEGMACTGGCVGGAGCLTHRDQNRMHVDKYAQASTKKTIGAAISYL